MNPKYERSQRTSCFKMRTISYKFLLANFRKIIIQNEQQNCIIFPVWALIVFSGFGITAGAHRLFSHKSYKANAKLRLLLTFLFTISGQVSLLINKI